MVVLVIAAYSITAVWEICTLARKRFWRDIVAFSFFLALSFVLSLLLCLGVKLPNPVDGIHNVLEWLGLHY